MDPSSYNGGTVVAMTGKDCVAIACDKRFGINFCTVGTNLNKINEIGPKLYIGISGLVTDSITLLKKLKFRTNMFELRENRKMSPKIFSSMVSNVLYEKRFSPYYSNVVIAGLNDNNKPFLSSMDVIGAESIVDDFAFAGNSSEQLCGTCESFWEPNLEPDDLFETISQTLINAFDRDAASGWGGYTYIIEKDKVTVTELKTRMD